MLGCNFLNISHSARTTEDAQPQQQDLLNSENESPIKARQRSKRFYISFGVKSVNCCILMSLPSSECVFVCALSGNLSESHKLIGSQFGKRKHDSWLGIYLW